MIVTTNKILTKEGYRPIRSISEGTRLKKGRIYDIFFVDSTFLYYVGFCNEKLIESTLIAPSDVFLITPEGRTRISDLKIGDRVLTYNVKEAQEEIKTITKFNKKNVKKATTAIIITTEDTYVVEGFVISNDRLS